MLAVVGDVGGTNVRLGLAEIGEDSQRIDAVVSEPAADHRGLCEAVAGYLDRLGVQPAAICLAVAGPVANGAVQQTNAPWSVTEPELVERLRVKRAVLINDFAAVAYAGGALEPESLASLGGPSRPRQPCGVRAFLGPGTGLGVAADLSCENGLRVVASEGGHASFAPVTELEKAIFERAARRLPRVSYEALLSGPGLQLIHACLGEIAGQSDAPLRPGEIVAGAVSGADEQCRNAVEIFCGALGGFAGDVALMFGAEAGVYLAGGVALKLRPFLEHGGFRARFEAKAPHRAYMSGIPTKLICDPFVALRGAAMALAVGQAGAAQG